MNDFKTCLKKSSTTFNEYFKSLVLTRLSGDFEIVEGVTKYKMAKTLDCLAGIDLWHFNSWGVRGLANRIQFGDTNWRTFTIRKSRESGAKTEYEKRRYAIDNELLYPVLTLQGYFNEKQNRVIGFAIAKTRDILEMIDNEKCLVRSTGQSQIGKADFYVVPWDYMRNEKYNLFIYPDDTNYA